MIKIPYKLVNGIMLIPATANDKEGFFAFDTGAMQTADKGTLNVLRFSDV